MLTSFYVYDEKYLAGIEIKTKITGSRVNQSHQWN